MRIRPCLLLAVGLLSAAPTLHADRLDPARAARLAEAERAIAAERWDDAQAILDELAGGLEVEEPVLAARLELALRRAGLRGAEGAAGGVPADVESAAAALERHPAPGHRTCVLLADEAPAAGNLDAAASWLTRAIQARPDDDASRLRLALLQMERGKPGDAATAALELVQRQPRCAGFLQLAGQGLLADGRVTAAIPVLERLVEVDADNAEARSLLGTALLVERRMEEAVGQLREAARLEPTPVRQANLGLALIYLGRTDEALELLGRLTTEHPEHGGGWINYGLALAGAGRLDEARAALVRALELDPDDERARANLADLDALTNKP